MGAWIEITVVYAAVALYFVAPFMGAWIEIRINNRRNTVGKVAPFMGAWIEMTMTSWRLYSLKSRTLHGCVD